MIRQKFTEFTNYNLLLKTRSCMIVSKYYTTRDAARKRKDPLNKRV
nr:MAG TPA: hypothetical protein [Caudoviricetes sp.]